MARFGLASRAIIYLPLAVLMVDLAVGDRTGETDQGGALRDLGMTAVGTALLPRRSFADDLDFQQSAPFWRQLTLILGVAGSATRGAVFTLAGVLVVVAAATASPAKAGGIDTAFRTVAQAPFGRVALVAAALGIAAFGLFALAEARWREVG